jgi:ribonucleoside-diphosphate reductase alpha chain
MTDRDDNLTDFGKETLKDRYLLNGESYQDLFKRVAKAFANDAAHEQRLYDYMSNLWFMPSTPILSNGGTSRGLPISCFLNEIQDSMNSISDNITENFWLSSKGGGIGTYIGNLRSLGEEIKGVGKSSGIIPFMKIHDSMTLAISQGGIRRASAAIYLPINHPEIEEFIEVRRPTGGDPNRKCLNLNNAVVIDDKFMNAVEDGKTYDLVSPKDDAVIKTVNARDLWIRLLTARIETGEPYIMFVDTVNQFMPEHQKKLGLSITTSNLCSEILLPTGIDYQDNNRTAVCCLSSLNLEKYDEWKDNPIFIKDVIYFLDNVLTSFITKASHTHKCAAYSAINERSIGLGVMGLHSLYQKNEFSWNSSEAYQLNIEIFSKIKKESDKANVEIAFERGACPDAINAGYMLRFSNVTAIAPTASISIICGGTSPGIEPTVANFYTHKTLSGSFPIKNPELKRLLHNRYNKDNDKIWSSIATNEGSVQHLDFLSDHEKDVFKTAYELNQYSIIAQASDRQPYIDQGQSLNLFLPPNISKKELHKIHMDAWKQNLKTLYYCRSQSIGRAEKPSEKVERVKIVDDAPKMCSIDNPECEACQ